MYVTHRLAGSQHRGICSAGLEGANHSKIGGKVHAVLVFVRSG